jgi:site-specific DNA-methyltransferase (adenine-specific)
MESIVFNEDCMEVMKGYPDKWFDLACIDPPYGIGEDGLKNHSRGKIAKSKEYTPKEWDSKAPSMEFFEEFFRVSKHQIIWGANHFIQSITASGVNTNSPCWIVWDKQNGETDFADCELAWTSFGSAVRKFEFRWQGMLQGDMKNKEYRIHPTQKPVKLYEWIFHNYAKPDFKILDTHLGSGSSRIAAHKAGLDFVGCELDKEYFEAADKRYKDFIAQLTLF